MICGMRWVDDPSRHGGGDVQKQPVPRPGGGRVWKESHVLGAGAATHPRFPAPRVPSPHIPVHHIHTWNFFFTRAPPCRSTPATGAWGCSQASMQQVCCDFESRFRPTRKLHVRLPGLPPAPTHTKATGQGSLPSVPAPVTPSNFAQTVASPKP